MLSHEVNPTREQAGWPLVAVLIVCALLGRGVYILRPFDSDSAMFIYMGRLICEGGRFGHDIVDNKLPTVGLLMAPIWRALGSSWIAYVALGMVLSILSCLALARAARRAFGDHAYRPTLLAALVLLNFHFAVFGGFQLETLHLFFASLAAMSALEALRRDDLRGSFVVGLCAGLAAYAKPTGLSVACAFAAATCVELRARPARLLAHAASGLIGLAIPAVCCVIYLIESSTLHEMPALLRQISLYAGNSVWDGVNLGKPIVVIVLAGFPLLIRGWVNRRERINRCAPTAMTIFVVTWLMLEFAGAVMQRRMYAYHFLPVAAPLALAFGMLPRRDRLIPLAASLAPLALTGLIGVWRVVDNPQPRTLECGKYLIQVALPGDRVWRDDAARLWLETGLASGSRHPLTFLFANYDSAPLEYGQNLLQDLQTFRPRYVVLPADVDAYVNRQRRQIVELEHFSIRGENYRRAWKDIAGFVQNHYIRDARIGEEIIWRRSESATMTTSIGGDAAMP